MVAAAGNPERAWEFFEPAVRGAFLASLSRRTVASARQSGIEIEAEVIRDVAEKMTAVGTALVSVSVTSIKEMERPKPIFYKLKPTLDLVVVNFDEYLHNANDSQSAYLDRIAWSIGGARQPVASKVQLSSSGSCQFVGTRSSAQSMGTSSSLTWELEFAAQINAEKGGLKLNDLGIGRMEQPDGEGAITVDADALKSIRGEVHTFGKRDLTISKTFQWRRTEGNKTLVDLNATVTLSIEFTTTP